MNCKELRLSTELILAISCIFFFTACKEEPKIDSIIPEETVTADSISTSDNIDSSDIADMPLVEYERNHYIKSYEIESHGPLEYKADTLIIEIVVNEEEPRKYYSYAGSRFHKSLLNNRKPNFYKYRKTNPSTGEIEWWAIKHKDRLYDINYPRDNDSIGMAGDIGFVVDMIHSGDGLIFHRDKKKSHDCYRLSLPVALVENAKTLDNGDLMTEVLDHKDLYLGYSTILPLIKYHNMRTVDLHLSVNKIPDGGQSLIPYHVKSSMDKRSLDLDINECQ